MPQAVNLLTFLPFFGALERSHHMLTLTLTFGQRPGTVHIPFYLKHVLSFASLNFNSIFSFVPLLFVQFHTIFIIILTI